MPYVYTGQFNSYVAKVTGQIIAFAKDPKKYKLNRYTQLVPTTTELFLYYLIHPDDFVRSVRPEGKIWMDGAKRPEQTGQRVRHKTVEGQCIRYDDDFQIGWRTLQVADYNVLLANTIAAQNSCMIDWTQETLTLAEAPSNWAGNTADATDLDGAAQWDKGTPENPVIKKSLGQIAEQITLGTNGIAGDFENAEDVKLCLVLGPRAARRMASSPEVHAIYKESLYSDALVTKQSANPNGVWQLPPALYGFTVIVESAVRVSTRPSADATAASTTGDPSLAARRFMKDYRSAFVCSRPGGVSGSLSAPNYSTFQRYHVGEELSVKIRDDGFNEYTDGHVNRFCTTKLAAPATGFLVTNILS